MYMFMVCITKPCSHLSGNEAKLKIYLSIFFTTNMHYPRMHTFSMHHPRMHTFSMHHPRTYLLPASFMHNLPASSMHTLYAACLPVAVMSVPIQVRVDGQGNLCPSQKGASNDLTQFVAAEVVEQYDHIMNCSTCSLSGVQLTSCSSEWEQREGACANPHTTSGTLYALPGSHCNLPCIAGCVATAQYYHSTMMKAELKRPEYE